MGSSVSAGAGRWVDVSVVRDLAADVAALGATVLFFELLDPPQLADLQPAVFRLPLEKVDQPIPCRWHRSAPLTPDWDLFRIPIICCSLNLFRFIVSSPETNTLIDPENATQTWLYSKGAGHLDS